MVTLRPNPTLADQVDRLEALVGAQARVLDLVGDNAALDLILGELADLFEAQIPGAFASISLANEDGTDLVLGRTSIADQRFREAVDTLPIVEGAGSCGTAAYRRQPVIVSDIAADSLWESLRSVALSAGLHACWSLPIVSSERMLGTFAAYWREPTYPTEHDLWVQHQFARLAQITIERAKTIDHITEVLESDRQRIAAAIHDDPIQVMTSAALRLQRLAASTTPAQAELLSAAQLEVNAAIDRLRHMLFELHPPDLASEGIAAAVECYVEQTVGQRPIDWTVQAVVATEPTLAIGSLTYRLAREAISNVVKHSRSSRAEVFIDNQDDGIAVRVVDHGTGFASATAFHSEPGHMGLTNSHYLALRASGRWSITCPPEGGTVVDFWLPIASVQRP